MKITGQDVPPELAALYAQHITPASAAQGPNGIVRTATATGKATTPRKKRGAATDLERIVAMLADAYRRDSNTTTDTAWRAARLAELKAGTFNADYWKPATLLASRRLTVTGSGAELSPRPPYDYAIATNRPTETTWSAPAPDTQAIGYTGALDGELYKDATWTYDVAEYQIPPRRAAAGETMAVAIINGTISVTTNQRGSRSMFSLMSRFEQRNTAAATLDDAPPPVNPATSHFWPFKPPVTEPPYYAASLPRIVAQLPTRTTETAQGQVVRLTYSVRPMFGRGNNNNNAVATEFEGAAQVFIIPATRAATDYLTLAYTDAYPQGIYRFSPATGELAFWRTMYDLEWNLAEVPDGYVERDTSDHYHLRDRRLWRVMQFEDALGPQGDNIRPGAAAGYYLGYDFDPYSNPWRYYRARWNLDGSLIAIDYQLTPWDTRYSNWYDSLPPSAHRANVQTAAPHGFTLVNEQGVFTVRDREWRIAATLDLDQPDYVQFDMLRWGENTIWFAVRDQDDIDDYYCLNVATIAQPPADPPPVITLHALYSSDDTMTNAAVLGDTLYSAGEWTAPFSMTQAGTRSAFAAIPEGYFITFPPYYPEISA